jgi:hypothetical protein
MSDLAQRIANLTPEQRALLEQRLMQRDDSADRREGIPRRNTEEPAILSFAQQRLWFLHQMEPDCVAYNISKAARISGPLDRAVLQKTLDALVERHEVLRTKFEAIDGNPVQVICPAGPVELPVLDLTAYTPEQQEAEVERQLVAESSRPFDLSQDMMVRASLICLSPEEHVLL